MKTFLEFIGERSFSLEGVRYSQTSFQSSAGEVPVIVDVGKVDAAWSRNVGFYIPPSAGTGKYRAAWERLESTGKATMPRVGWVEARRDEPALAPGWIGFDDGRHTFAVLRDMGKKKAYLSVDPSQTEIFRKMFG